MSASQTEFWVIKKMELDNNLYVKKESKDRFIEESILSNVSEEDKDSIRPKVHKIAENYIGKDLEALSILYHAAKQGKEKLEYFIKSLNFHYDALFHRIPIGWRRRGGYYKDFENEKFFAKCFEELGCYGEYISKGPEYLNEFGEEE